MIIKNASIIYLWVILSIIIIFVFKLLTMKGEISPVVKAYMTGIEEKKPFCYSADTRKIIDFIWNLNVPTVHFYVDI